MLRQSAPCINVLIINRRRIMKLLLKYIVYSLLIIVLISGTVLLYRSHPEAQLAFIIPGLFILAFITR